MTTATPTPAQVLTDEQIERLRVDFCARDIRLIAVALSAPAAPTVEPAEPAAKALEFAEYMAKGAEQFLNAANEYAGAIQALEDGESIPGSVMEQREQALSEFATGLRSGIYEFRKRAARAGKGEA